MPDFDLSDLLAEAQAVTEGERDSSRYLPMDGSDVHQQPVDAGAARKVALEQAKGRGVVPWILANTGAQNITGGIEAGVKSAGSGLASVGELLRIPGAQEERQRLTNQTSDTLLRSERENFEGGAGMPGRIARNVAKTATEFAIASPLGRAVGAGTKIAGGGTRLAQALGGGAVIAPIVGAQATTQAEESGLTGADKAGYITGQIAAEGIPTAVFSFIGLPGMEAMLRPGAGQLLKGSTAAFLKQAGMKGLEEVPEELSSDLLGGIVDRIFLPENKTKTVGDIIGDFIESAPETALTAFFAPGATMAAGRIVDRAAAPSERATFVKGLEESLNQARALRSSGMSPSEFKASKLWDADETQTDLQAINEPTETTFAKNWDGPLPNQVTAGPGGVKFTEEDFAVPTRTMAPFDENTPETVEALDIVDEPIDMGTETVQNLKKRDEDAKALGSFFDELEANASGDVESDMNGQITAYMETLAPEDRQAAEALLAQGLREQQPSTAAALANVQQAVLMDQSRRDRAARKAKQADELKAQESEVAKIEPPQTSQQLSGIKDTDGLTHGRAVEVKIGRSMQPAQVVSVDGQGKVNLKMSDGTMMKGVLPHRVIAVDESKLETNKPGANLIKLANDALGSEVSGKSKADILRDKADKLTARAMSMLDGIPAGQPIQSQADRNLRNKSADMMSDAVEMSKRADAMSKPDADVANPDKMIEPAKEKKPYYIGPVRLYYGGTNKEKGSKLLFTTDKEKAERNADKSGGELSYVNLSRSDPLLKDWADKPNGVTIELELPSEIADKRESELTRKASELEETAKRIRNEYGRGRVPAETIGDILYHESSVHYAKIMVNPLATMNIPYGDGSDVWFTNIEELALGQGQNKGVLIEVDAKGLYGIIKDTKPGLGDVTGNHEMVIPGNLIYNIKRNVRAITIKDDLVKNNTHKDLTMLMARMMKNDGWVKSKVEAGVRFERSDVAKENAGKPAKPKQEQAPVEVDSVAAESAPYEIGQRVEITKGRQAGWQGNVTSLIDGRAVITMDSGRVLGAKTGIDPARVGIVESESTAKVAVKQDVAPAVESKPAQVKKEPIAKVEPVKNKINTAKLRKAAAAISRKANESISRDRNTNTPKRLREATNSIREANRQNNIADMANRIADAIDAGSHGSLEAVSSPADIESIENRLSRARHSRLSYAEYEKSKDDPYTKDDVDAAKLDFAYINDSQVSSVIGYLKGTRGLAPIVKRIGQKNHENGFKNSSLEVLDAVSDLAKLGAGIKDASYYAKQLSESVTKGRRDHKLGFDNIGTMRKVLSDYVDLQSGVKVDPEQKKKQAIKDKENAIRFVKIPGFFPTPAPLIELVIDKADIKSGHRVLEPEGGKGDLAQAAKDAGGTVEVAETQNSLREILTDKGFNLVGNDMLEITAGGYDRIVMNPPFENGQDREHVQHAYTLLKPEGRLVAIMSQGPFNRSMKADVAFREWFESVNGVMEDNQEGSFKGKAAFRETGVSTVTVVIDKPASEDVSDVAQNENLFQKERDLSELPEDLNMPDAIEGIESLISYAIANRERVIAKLEKRVSKAKNAETRAEYQSELDDYQGVDPDELAEHMRQYPNHYTKSMGAKGGSLDPVHVFLQRAEMPPSVPRLGISAMKPEGTNGKPPDLRDAIAVLAKSLKKVGKQAPELTVDRGALPDGSAGSYSTRTGAIRSLHHNDLDTVAHEVGHWAADIYKLMPAKDAKAIRQELAILSQHGSPGKGDVMMHEGMAEYFRGWMVNPGAVQSAAPEFTAHMLSKVPQNVMDSLRTYGDSIRQYEGSPAVRKVGAGVTATKTATRDEQAKAKVSRLIVDGVLGLFGSGKRKPVARPSLIPRKFNATKIDKIRFAVTDEQAPMLANYLTSLAITGQNVKSIQESLRWDVMRKAARGQAQVLRDMVLEYGLVNRDMTIAKDPVTKEKIKLDWLLGPIMKHENWQDVLDRAHSYGVSQRSLEIEARLRDDLQKRIEEFTDERQVELSLKGYKRSVAEGQIKEFIRIETEIIDKQVARLTGAGGGIYRANDIARKAIKELESDVDRSDIEEYLRRYRVWSAFNLSYAVQSRILSPTSAKKMAEANEFYIDWHRVFGEDDGPINIGEAVEGSTRTIHNPLASLMHATWSVVGRGDVNMLMHAFTAPLRLNPTDSADRSIASLGQVLSGEAAKKASEQNGYHDDQEGERKRVYRLQKNVPMLDEKGDVIVNKKTGEIVQKNETEHWVFDSGTEASLEAGRASMSDHPWMLLMQGLNSLQRNMITMSPSFRLKVPVRDNFERIINSEVGSGVKDIPAIIAKSVKLDGRSLDELFALSGAGMAGWNQQGREQALASVFTHVEDLKKSGWHVVTPHSFIKWWNNMGEAAENVARKQEFATAYRKARADGKTVQDSSLVAMEHARGLLDTAERGYVIGRINGVALFLNASVKGLQRSTLMARKAVKAYRAGDSETGNRLAKVVGIRAATWGASLAAIRLMLLSMMGDEEKEKEYLSQPAWKRDFSIQIDIPGLPKIAIAKPYEWGWIGSGFDRMADYAWAKHRGWDDIASRSFEGYAKSFMGAVTPVDEGTMAGSFGPMIEVLANYSFFRQSSIIPQYEEKKDLDLREGQKHASLLGQGVSAVLPVDARNIDHLVRSYFGGFGSMATAKSWHELIKRTTGYGGETSIYSSRDVDWVLDYADRRGVTGNDQVSALRKTLRSIGKMEGEAKEKAEARAREIARNIRNRYDK